MLPGQPASAAPDTGIMLHGLRRPKLPGGLPVSCPMATAYLVEGVLPLPITSMEVTAQCQISTVFVSYEIRCQYPQHWPPAQLELFVPKSTNTTITQLVMENEVRDSVFATVVVPLEDVQKGGFKPAHSASAAAAAAAAGRPQQQQSPGGGSDNSDDPDLFRLALPTPAQPGDKLCIRLNYFQPLEFEQGAYVVTLPTELPSQVLQPGQSVSDVLNATTTIATGTGMPVDWKILSGHAVAVGINQPGLVTLSLNTSGNAVNADFKAGYQVWGNDMYITLSVTAPTAPSPHNPDPRGSFVLSVAPPAPEHTQSHSRSIVFILDRSGSMGGESMESAKAALITGLGMLSTQDEFTVVAFDHEQIWFSQALVPATPDAVAQCTSWIRGSVTARGMTDIMTPLKTALLMLASARGLPFIFLITDGCVDNERQICKHVQEYVKASVPPGHAPPKGLPRVSTFAIGRFANHYFLKQLACIGRGMFDVAFRPHSIQAQVQRMLMASQKPVLSDVTISIPSITSCELYPYPIPDLFCGMPLLVAGKYEGMWPETITVNGTLPNGQAWSSRPVPASKDSGVPLDQVFIKQRLDLMTAQAWLQADAKELVGKVVDLSVATGVPCAYTRTIGFETTHAQHQAMMAQQQAQGRRKLSYAKFALGGAAGIAVVAGVAAAFAFGDLAATLANSGVFDAIGDLVGGLGDVVGEVAGAVGDGCGDACSDGCGALCDGLGGIADIGCTIS